MSNYSTSEDDLTKKENLQEKHYWLLRELQSMCREIPLMYQQRLPNELLSSLANSLLDNNVFEIVKGLTDIQAITERSLMEKRMNVVNTQKEASDDMLKRHKDSLSFETDPAYIKLLKEKQARELSELIKWQEEELNRLDMKIILELDQAVNDQQVTLEKIGVPGFFVSSKDTDVRLQMYILNFIRAIRDRVEH
ncbi:protein DGCR6-like [Uloborus diversus]|uniref:protein DGCR6-like n=1 Tax=Uloborus diversus TaxID=327109 RepID=UPI00240A296C|nr:protein DGCR6-like [Uloborus diversus]